MREEAYKKAMEDAKTRAQKLADLAGVKLGPILSVHDGGQKGRRPNSRTRTTRNAASAAAE